MIFLFADEVAVVMCEVAKILVKDIDISLCSCQSARSMEFREGEIIKILRVNPNGKNSHAFRYTVIMSMPKDARSIRPWSQ
jgi:hypothetical protein